MIFKKLVFYAKSSVIGVKVVIKLHYIEYFMGGGGFFVPFVHVDRGGGM